MKMDKKGMYRGAIIKIIIMMLLIGIVIIFLGKSYSKMVIIAIDLGIIKQSEITESVEAGTEDGTDISSADRKTWNAFVNDMKSGFEKSIDQGGTPKPVCRYDIKINAWPPNQGKKGYLFRLMRTADFISPGIDAIGFKEDYDYVEMGGELIGKIASINEKLSPCIIKSFKEFELSSPKYNLKYDLTNLNFFRREENKGILETFLEKDQKLLSTDPTTKDTYTVIRLDDSHSCFVTDRGIENAWYQSVGDFFTGDDSEKENLNKYLENLKNIPICEELNCGAKYCNNIDKKEDCIASTPCCEWDKQFSQCRNDCDLVSIPDCKKLGSGQCGQHDCCTLTLNGGCTHQFLNDIPLEERPLCFEVPLDKCGKEEYYFCELEGSTLISGEEEMTCIEKP